MLVVHAVLPIKPENRDAFVEAAKGLVEASRAEPGNLEYGFYESIETPGEFRAVERYVDQAAFQAHVTSEHFQAASAGLAQWLAAPPQITMYPAEEGQPVGAG
ncbi:putative quinol monooxygenase [Conexibacter sp. SYSU D00693]|uniref:putative quinol monooxygenase n=1 Tax=Conexibacter sp. SYSU D00693 TaxID=2812560 RepID=UPI00196BAD51|nr:putative quinol monooxygenase [Conexibacter sp. SYSU D00693]